MAEVLVEPYKTNDSGFAAYATAFDLIDYRDWRLIGDLIRDDDKRAANTVEITGTVDEEGAVVDPPNARVQRALNTATAMIEAEIFHGGRYSRADMKALLRLVTDPDEDDPELADKYTMARDYLRQLTCDLAFWVLIKRRKPDAAGEKINGVKEALETLVRLRNGEAIFAFQEATEAGVMNYSALDPYTSQADYEARKPFRVSTNSTRMFGKRANGQ